VAITEVTQGSLLSWFAHLLRRISHVDVLQRSSICGETSCHVNSFGACECVSVIFDVIQKWQCTCAEVGGRRPLHCSAWRSGLNYSCWGEERRGLHVAQLNCNFACRGGVFVQTLFYSRVQRRPGASSTCRLNCVQWRLIFVILQYVTRFWRLEFWGGS
jgi:hypothetical protein